MDYHYFVTFTFYNISHCCMDIGNFEYLTPTKISSIKDIWKMRSFIQQHQRKTTDTITILSYTLIRDEPYYENLY